MMIQPHDYRPGDHRSRREIDLAIGVLMGMRRCSAQQALESLVDATKASGVGLGGVSSTLLAVIGGDAEPAAAEEPLAHWQAVLGLPRQRGI